MKTVLGPKSYDKIFVETDGEVSITNDGATVLTLMKKQSHPAAKLLIQLSEAMDNQTGDGTTSVVVLATALLHEAKNLLSQGVHVMDIIRGFTFALTMIEEPLKNISTPLPPRNDSSLEPILLQIATTTLSSKISSHVAPTLARIAVRACLQVGVSDHTSMLDCIHTIRDKGGECQLIEPSPCIIIPDDPKKPLSQAITTPKVAVLTFDLNPSSNKLGYVNNTSSMSTEQVDRMLKHEDEFYKKLAVQVRKLGINVIILQEKLTSAEDPVPEAAAKLFTRAKVTVLRPFQKEQIRMVCDVSGIRPIVSHSQLFELSKDTASAHVFDFKSINPILVSIPYIQIVPETVKRNHVSIVLGGPTLTAIEEIDRALHDVLRVLESSCLSNGVVPGGGACEMAISAFISNKMQSMESIHGTVVESFCKGLEQIPRLLCERAGLNPTGCMNRLKIAHSTEPKCKKGIFLGEQNGICDLAERGVLELLENKLMLIRMATQTAIQVLKIDGVHQVKS